MAKYKLLPDGYILDQEREWIIPPDTANMDYVEYLAWVDEGNTPDPYQTAEEIEAEKWMILRSDRTTRLMQTDFMMTYDFYNSVLTEQEKTDLTTYRQALRDLPDNTVDIDNVVWPTKPQIVLDYGL
jgi:outer membrane protein OmpA-like peptidoglycan-associated protein